MNLESLAANTNLGKFEDSAMGRNLVVQDVQTIAQDVSQGVNNMEKSQFGQDTLDLVQTSKPVQAISNFAESVIPMNNIQENWASYSQSWDDSAKSALMSLAFPGMPTKCPGYENRDDCKYPATPSNSQFAWDCKAGQYCPNPMLSIPCTAGYYCPANATMASVCPAGYYCATVENAVLCPQGSYCPAGSNAPQPCFGPCEEGTSVVNRLNLALTLIGLSGFFWLFFYLREQLHRGRELYLQKKKELAKRNAFKKASTTSTTSTNTFASDAPTIQRLSRTFDIDFENISLMLPNGTEIMTNVTGSLRSGHTAAIMGPSGAGKTTLVTLLTGKVKRTTGIVRLNGKVDELANYKKLIGYVPQEDVMLRELRVKDILMHSASMRLPRDRSPATVKEKVEEIVKVLGLSHIRKSIIGDAETRGISGGQRKRVNIGMELVAEPSVLFLDEPTSGLDSSTSFEVCSKLRELAQQQGLTVVTVIHSPSPATFKQFDDLILLGKGGRLVYLGPREDAKAYFDSMGFTCPADESPSDFFMDVVTGRIPSQFDVTFEPKHLFKYWELHQKKEHPFPGQQKWSPEEAFQKAQEHKISKTGLTLEEALDGALEDPESGKKKNKVSYFTKLYASLFKGYRKTGKYLMSKIYSAGAWWKDVWMEWLEFVERVTNAIRGRADPIRQSITFTREMYLLMSRASDQVFVSASALIQEACINFFIGALISVATKDFDFIGAPPLEMCLHVPWSIEKYCLIPQDTIPAAGQFICLGGMIAAITISMGTFGKEKVVYWRDSSAGMNGVSYYLAKAFIDIPRIVLGALMYSTAVAMCFGFRQQFISVFSIMTLVYMSAFPMGYFVSILVPYAKSTMAGLAFCLLWALPLSGVEPPLAIIQTYNPFMQSIFSFSVARWAIEAIWINEITARPFDEKDKPSVLGYDQSRLGLCFVSLGLIVIAWHFIAFLTLKLSARGNRR